MRYLLLFLIVTVFVALAYSSPVPETAAAAQGKGVAAKKGPGGVAVGPKGRPLKNGGKRRNLQAGRGGKGGKPGLRRVLKAGKGGPGVGPNGKKRIVKRRRPAAA